MLNNIHKRNAKVLVINIIGYILILFPVIGMLVESAYPLIGWLLVLFKVTNDIRGDSEKVRKEKSMKNHLYYWQQKYPLEFKEFIGELMDKT